MALGVLLATLALFPYAVAPARGSMELPGTAFDVTIFASPQGGTAPLEVQFNEAVSSGSPTNFSWSFGDGSFLNGSNTSDSRPIHTFQSPGNYTVSLTVAEGSAVANTSRLIAVGEGPLSVVITATPSVGPSPLTVVFRAIVTGGTGTYLDLAWRLGNGGTGLGPLVADTYLRPGAYAVTVEVTDSQGNHASAATTVQVNGSASETASSIPITTYGFVVIGALGAGSALTWRWYRRSHPPELLPGEASLIGADFPPVGEGLGISAVSGPGESLVQEMDATEPMGPPTSAGTDVGEAALVTEILPDTPLTARRLISRRLIVHLAELGYLGAEDVPDSRWTQAGLSESLAVTQNGVSNVLRRLVAAGVVVEELRHGSGRPRRVKVYCLSSRGESLAKDYRRSGPERSP